MPDGEAGVTGRAAQRCRLALLLVHTTMIALAVRSVSAADASGRLSKDAWTASAVDELVSHWKVRFAAKIRHGDEENFRSYANSCVRVLADPDANAHLLGNWGNSAVNQACACAREMHATGVLVSAILNSSDVDVRFQAAETLNLLALRPSPEEAASIVSRLGRFAQSVEQRDVAPNGDLIIRSGEEIVGNHGTAEIINRLIARLAPDRPEKQGETPPGKRPSSFANQVNAGIPTPGS